MAAGIQIALSSILSRMIYYRYYNSRVLGYLYSIIRVILGYDWGNGHSDFKLTCSKQAIDSLLNTFRL